MGEYSEAFVAFDTSKTKHAVAIADGGRGGKVRFLGDISNSPAAVVRLIRKLAGRYGKLHFCYEARPTRYGLYRQIQALGHACLVIGTVLVSARFRHVTGCRRACLSSLVNGHLLATDMQHL